jgi:hypothetical protein
MLLDIGKRACPLHPADDLLDFELQQEAASSVRSAGIARVAALKPPQAKQIVAG